MKTYEIHSDCDIKISYCFEFFIMKAIIKKSKKLIQEFHKISRFLFLRKKKQQISILINQYRTQISQKQNTIRNNNQKLINFFISNKDEIRTKIKNYALLFKVYKIVKKLQTLESFKFRMISSKTKIKQNIQIIISIGDYNLQMSIPRQTKVSSLLTIVKNYEKIHDAYAPINSYFIGLASKDNNPVIDYWLTQDQLDFCRFTKRKLQLKALYSIERCISKLTILDFQFLKCLGKGAIGEVYLVRNKVTGYLFAMKRLRKQAIHDYKNWEAVIREKKILSSFPPNNHTVTFHGSFESQNYFNFLLDYYPGGELFIHLVEKDLNLSEKQIKIYFCEILLAMEYLHKNKILYRDLKPENILVDIQGHLRITDFGMSKFGFQEENVADTICGSDQYMAPELIENKNYNFSADFYCIGAILYEFLTNLPPYYDNENPYEKLQQMKAMDLDMSFTNSPHLKSLLTNLLNPIPELRLCNFQEIKNNPWLADIDWKEIQSKKQTLKFAPDIYKSYIGEEFLQLQQEVQRMNGEQDEDFQPIFQGLFNFIKPTSELLVLGSRTSSASSKNSLCEKQSNKIFSKDQMNMKRKTTCFIKEKSKYMSKNKQNFSIQLYEKQDSTTSTHTTSTQNSNVSSLPYDPKTTRNADSVKNKENISNFKKPSSKKLTVINDALAKITRHPSQKKLISKQPSQGNILKEKLPKGEQKIFLKQTTTPIRLVTNQSVPVVESKLCSHFVSTRDDRTLCQSKEKENHLISRSKLQTYHPITTRDPSTKRLTSRHSQNFSSIKEDKQNQKRTNMKSKPKQKSKSRDKLEIKVRTKQNFPFNSNTIVKATGTKVKLPASTYKIKLV